MSPARWSVAVGILALGFVSFAIACATRGDATALQIWLSVALTLVVAAFVDAVALLDAEQRQREHMEQLQPIVDLVERTVRAQIRDIRYLVYLMYAPEVPLDHAELRRHVELHGDAIVDSEAGLAIEFPPSSRAAIVTAKLREVRDRQANLNSLVAAGSHIRETARLAILVGSHAVMGPWEAMATLRVQKISGTAMLNVLIEVDAIEAIADSAAAKA